MACAGSPDQLALTIHAFRGAFSRALRWATSSQALDSEGNGDSGCNSSVKFCSADVLSGPVWESMVPTDAIRCNGTGFEKRTLQLSYSEPMLRAGHLPPSNRTAPEFLAGRFATALGNERWRRFAYAHDASRKAVLAPAYLNSPLLTTG